MLGSITDGGVVRPYSSTWNGTANDAPPGARPPSESSGVKRTTSSGMRSVPSAT
jgi:hypothetical protein